MWLHKVINTEWNSLRKMIHWSINHSWPLIRNDWLMMMTTTSSLLQVSVELNPGGPLNPPGGDLLHLRAVGGNDTLHYMYCSLGAPTLLLVHTNSSSSTLKVKTWNRRVTGAAPHSHVFIRVLCVLSLRWTGTSFWLVTPAAVWGWSQRAASSTAPASSSAGSETSTCHLQNRKLFVKQNKTWIYHVFVLSPAALGVRRRQRHSWSDLWPFASVRAAELHLGSPQPVGSRLSTLWIPLKRQRIVLPPGQTSSCIRTAYHRHGDTRVTWPLTSDMWGLLSFQFNN